MCLAAFAWRVHAACSLVLMANRDEFYSRNSAPAEFWAGAPQVLAGRDLEGGGTWLGVTRSGRLAFLTNFRDPKSLVAGAPSRGSLVSSFLLGNEPPGSFLDRIRPEASQYNGFNLVLGTGEELWWFSNRSGETRMLEPGIYGLSNAFLDTPWPKVRRAKENLRRLLGAPVLAAEPFFQSLVSIEEAPDGELPETGVPLEWERRLSAQFIKSPGYGTRSSTVLLIGRDGDCLFEERTYERDPEIFSRVSHAFRLTSAG